MACNGKTRPAKVVVKRKSTGGLRVEGEATYQGRKYKFQGSLKKA